MKNYGKPFFFGNNLASKNKPLTSPYITPQQAALIMKQKSDRQNALPKNPYKYLFVKPGIPQEKSFRDLFTGLPTKPKTSTDIANLYKEYKKLRIKSKRNKSGGSVYSLKIPRSVIKSRNTAKNLRPAMLKNFDKLTSISGNAKSKKGWLDQAIGLFDDKKKDELATNVKLLDVKKLPAKENEVVVQALPQNAIKIVTKDNRKRIKLRRKIKIKNKEARSIVPLAIPTSKVDRPFGPNQALAIPAYKSKRPFRPNRAQKKARKKFDFTYKDANYYKLDSNFTTEHGITPYAERAVRLLKPLIFENIRKRFLKVLNKTKKSGDDTPFEDYMRIHKLDETKQFAF